MLRPLTGSPKMFLDGDLRAATDEMSVRMKKSRRQAATTSHGFNEQLIEQHLVATDCMPLPAAAKTVVSPRSGASPSARTCSPLRLECTSEGVASLAFILMK